MSDLMTVTAERMQWVLYRDLQAIGERSTLDGTFRQVWLCRQACTAQ
jgi:hypothetical protein